MRRFIIILFIFSHLLTQSAFAFEFNPGVVQPVLVPSPVFSLSEGYQLPEANKLLETGTFAGQPIKTQDPNGNITEFSYFTSTGYLQTITQDPNPSGQTNHINAVTSFTYDAFGNIASVADANNHTTSFTHNENNWLINTTNPLGNITKNTYDANGNITKIEKQASNPSGTWQTTQYAYNILNDITSITDPLNRPTTFGYDGNQNRTTVTDALNHTTTTAYDERDLALTVTDANSPAGVTAYDYDLNGNLKKITDAGNNATSYTYDGFDRKASMVYADNSSHTYQYDKNSNLTQDHLPSNKVINYEYDVLNRLTAKRYPLNANGIDALFTYDLGSRLLTATNYASTVTFAYDALNRVVSETNFIAGVAVPLTVGSSYDAVGNRTTINYPPGVDINSVFDANNRRTSVNAVGALNLIGYTYDALDRVTVKDIYATVPQQQHYSYDIANQISSVSSDIVGFGAVYNRNYANYDAVGNRLDKQLIFNGTPIWTENYGYNNIYELTSVTGSATHSYAYDKVNNRTTVDGTSYTHNNVNQYTTVGSTTLNHDGNGNTTFDGINTFTYDEENRIIHAVNSVYTSDYAFDALDRRVGKIVAQTGQPTSYVAYLYSGDQIIEQIDPLSSQPLPIIYIYGNGLDEPISMYNNNLYAYHEDGLGSIDAVIDWNGNVAEYNLYDAYGQPSILSSPINNLFMFTGRQWDPETGTYQYRARQYSPTLGRFLQRDPVGYYDSMNLMQYTKNNPINYIDPRGNVINLGAAVVGGIIGGVVGGATAAINNQDVGVGLITGMGVGALGGLTLGTSLIAEGIIGGTSAVAGNIVNQAITAKQNNIDFIKSFDFSSVAISSVAGILGGLTSGILLIYEGPTVASLIAGTVSGAVDMLLNIYLRLNKQINLINTCPSN